MSLAAEAKKAKLMRQYAGSRIDLNLDDDAKSDFLSSGKSGRRQSMRKGSVFVGMGNSKHRQEIKDDEPESLLLPMPGRRKSRRHSTIQGLGAPPLDKHMAKRSSLLPSDESGSKPSMSKRNSLVPGADKGRRSSLLPPGFKQNRRRSSARRNSTFDAFIQKKGGRKFSINDDDDDENKLVIKDGRIKDKPTEEKAKIPKLKCSLLQDYARSRVTAEDEEDDDLLVPEKRLNLLMKSPSITRRRASMMPSSTNGWSWQSNINLPALEASKNEETSDNDDEEELPLLAIPKILLRRASTQLGIKGLPGFKLGEDGDDEETSNLTLGSSDPIKEEIEEELEDENITIEVSDEVPKIEIEMKKVEPMNTEPIILTEEIQIDADDESKIIENNTGDVPIPDDTDNNILEEIFPVQELVKSSESVASYFDIESIPVPYYPRANEPPLEFYPYALTKSNNSILYVIAESLAVPRLFAPSEATTDPSETSSQKNIPSLDDNSMQTESSTEKHGEDKQENISNISDEVLIHESSSTTPVKSDMSIDKTPVKLGSLFCPWARAIHENSRSMPNIKSNSCTNSPVICKDSTVTNDSNIILMPESCFEEKECTKEECSINILIEDSSDLPNMKCNQILDASNLQIVNETSVNDGLTNDHQSIIDQCSEPNSAKPNYYSKSRSSFFLPRSNTVETFIEDDQDGDKPSDAFNKVSKSLGNFDYMKPNVRLETILSQSSLDPNTPAKTKETSSSSSSSFGSLLDDYNDDDLEKTNATLVAVLTVIIVMFFVILFSTIFILAISLPSGHQGRLLTHNLCKQIPSWNFIENTTQSWCDERIFMTPFDKDFQCPCFSPNHKPSEVDPLWPYTGVYVNH